MGSFGWLNLWYIPNGIANIFSMHELKKHYKITYDSWEGFYQVHTPRGVVKFHKDEQGLPYIDLNGLAQEAATMLVQLGIGQHPAMRQTPTKHKHTMLVETVRGDYKGVTKTRGAQTMMRSPSEKDYKGLVSNHLISNCPVAATNINNSRCRRKQSNEHQCEW